MNTMTDIFKILVSKNLATDKQINSLYGAYISTRMFHEAQELKSTLVGWPKEGNRDKLLHGLKGIGIKSESLSTTEDEFKS